MWCHREIECCTLNAARSARGAIVISEAAYWMQLARHVVPSWYQRLRIRCSSLGTWCHRDIRGCIIGCSSLNIMISEIAYGYSLPSTWCHYDISGCRLDAVRSARGAIMISQISYGCSSLGTWCHRDIEGCTLNAVRSARGAIIISKAAY